MQPLGNFITSNHAQGILLEEGCSARITENYIAKNMKANIALGGKGTGLTMIKCNHIEKSKAEGIFVVEAEAGLTIDKNIIKGNQEGIVLLHSEGKITNNQIIENERQGIYCVSETNADIVHNHILNN